MKNSEKIISLEQEVQHLKWAVDELAFLNELSTTIGSSYSSEGIMQTIIGKSIRAIHAEQGSIVLVADEDDRDMKTLVRSVVSTGGHAHYRLNQNLIGWIRINNKSINIKDAKNDPRFKNLELDESIKSIACIPLFAKSKLIGILSVYNKKGEDCFSENDLRLLSIIASQSAQIIENARLYEEEKVLTKLKEEARLAREIQIHLLPEDNPRIPGYDIAGKSVPAMSVGGDYYDFITLKDNNLAVCLGDISGKGIPAAMLMSNLQASVRGQLLIAGPPNEYVSRTNNMLCQCIDSNKFATFFLGILDYSKNEMCYTNAGHNPPMLFKNGSDPVMLGKGGPVLGFVQNIRYLTDAIALDPGDICVIYSDGITEAFDKIENEFGEERLKSIVKENKESASDELVEKIIQAVNEHSQDVPQSDDITIIVIRRE